MSQDDDVKNGEAAEPEVYAVQRDGAGWSFSRRGFLAAAASAGTTVAAAGCKQPRETTIFQTRDAAGNWVTQTLEGCGGSLPQGAVCVCNCVPAEPAPGGGVGPGTQAQTPTAPPTAAPPAGGNEAKSSPSPSPKPTATSTPRNPSPGPAPGPCSCVPVHYWYPN